MKKYAPPFTVTCDMIPLRRCRTGGLGTVNTPAFSVRPPQNRVSLVVEPREIRRRNPCLLKEFELPFYIRVQRREYQTP